MRILVKPAKLQSISEDLADLSRYTRRLGEEAAQIRLKLRTLSELDECQRVLSQQELSIAELSGRMTALASALSSVGAQYDSAEHRNASLFDFMSDLQCPTTGGALSCHKQEMRIRLERILRPSETDA